MEEIQQKTKKASCFHETLEEGVCFGLRDTHPPEQSRISLEEINKIVLKVGCIGIPEFPEVFRPRPNPKIENMSGSLREPDEGNGFFYEYV